MMDLRYHVVSMVGVFLALSAGFVMGVAMSRAENQATVVDSLRRQFQALTEKDTRVMAENQQLHQQLATWDRVGRDMRAPVLRRRLDGDRVAIAVCGAPGLPSYWPDLRAALTDSGALPGPILYLPDDPPTLDATQRLKFSQLWDLGRGPGPVERYESLRWLVKAMSQGGLGAQINDLASVTGIRIEGSFVEPVRRLLVLVAPPSPERASRVAHGDAPESALVDAATLNGVRAVVGEETNAPVSIVAAFAHRAPTVDDVDTVIGQIAAVLALAYADGAFGVKLGAASPLPPIAP
jgi:Copper transport outer membrane protein, MctB